MELNPALDVRNRTARLTVDSLRACSANQRSCALPSDALATTQTIRTICFARARSFMRNPNAAIIFSCRSTLLTTTLPCFEASVEMQ